MDTVEIELRGGPLHGKSMTVRADPMNPPDTYEMYMGSEAGRVVYRRVVNPADSGPLWLYLHEEQPDDRTEA